MAAIRFNYGNDDESFKKYARKNAFSFFHPVGTCRMGDGVDDSVVSAENLRSAFMSFAFFMYAQAKSQRVENPTHDFVGKRMHERAQI